MCNRTIVTVDTSQNRLIGLHQKVRHQVAESIVQTRPIQKMSGGEHTSTVAVKQRVGTE